MSTNAEKWEAFGRAVLKGWPDCDMLDGADLQGIGEQTGVLVPERRTTFCDEGDLEKIDCGYCNCREYFGEDEAEAGFTCYRVLEP